ncbi:hypothetical protein H310_02125 [Aphanomyces invadans]|nr:hypothetical protein H310_02125 [Aphanomyces invadans]ETW07662.1 hypothetical protein H310_02125 [Aphanomyces invadans]|eukprot:XP_008863755.1 hypothetical protein H310_02125 [Aphanomyces invadans]
MADNSWREHSSLQNISDGGGKGDATKGRGRAGPQFNRVIPKFLQKYHTPETLDHEASLALKRPKEVDDEADDDDELDEVQKEALEAYKAEQDKNKHVGVNEEVVEKADEAPRPEKRKSMTFSSTSKKGLSSTAQGATTTPPAKKRKAVNNAKLLSFSMDDD